jgi:hypothetical protein
MAIDWTKPVQTRNGRKVRVLCTDGPDLRYPVIGVVAGMLCPETWTIDGVHFVNGAPSNLDIINTPDPPVTVTGWVNVWPDRAYIVHHTRDDATFYHGANGPIACVPATFSYRPGEGLD